jgi:hypothetical protein
VLAPFKYAGYPQLLEVLRQQTPTTSTATTSAPAPAAPHSNGPSSAAPAPGTTTTSAAGAPAAAGTSPGSSSSEAPTTTGGGSSGAAGHFLSPERVDLVLAAIELCWLTCAASHRNAEELLRAGGVGVLGDLLSR